MFSAPARYTPSGPFRRGGDSDDIPLQEPSVVRRPWPPGGRDSELPLGPFELLGAKVSFDLRNKSETNLRLTCL